jgi:hypothetical protein
MLLLGEVFVPLAPSDEFFGVTQSCGPIQGSLEVLTQKVHSTPNTQQAEQSWLHTRREQKTCQSIFLEN